jgi:hypothetical protein
VTTTAAKADTAIMKINTGTMGTGMMKSGDPWHCPMALVVFALQIVGPAGTWADGDGNRRRFGNSH